MSEPPIMFGRTLVIDTARKAADLTGVDIAAIMGPNRDADVCTTRFAVMRVAYDAGRTTSQIGRVLKMNHTSVSHGVRRSHEMEADPDFAELLRRLKSVPAETCPTCLRAFGGQNQAYPQLPCSALAQPSGAPNRAGA